MECSHIKGLLSDYIDGMLEKETRALVEAHLSACEACRAEHDALKALVQELGSMEPVAPSADFLERLHDRMDRRSPVSSLIRTLFVPMRFKIPLEFAAVAIVAVIIFSLVNVPFDAYKAPQEPLQKLERKAMGEKASSKGLSRTTREEAFAPSAPQESDMAKRPEKGRALPELAIFITPKRTGRVMKSKALQAPPQPAWEQERQRAAGALLPDAERADRMQMEAEPGSGASLPEDKAPPSLASAHEVTQMVRNAVVTAGGEILPGEETRQKSMRQDATGQEVIASIPAKNYPFLMEKLHALGTLQVPGEGPSQEQEGPLQLRIKVLPEK